MKLKARIIRDFTGRSKAIRLYFPPGVTPYIREAIITRNIGPRPWSEAAWTNDAGEAVRIYIK